MNNMIKEVEIYKNLKSEIKGLETSLVKYQISSENELGRFYENIDSKLNDFNPKIMLYGCYNSGKSTIINTLLGKEVAKVGDAPETSKVTPYEYHNYTIYDTPGINAPIEHEIITKEKYKQCEVILFVMSNDSAPDAEQTYSEIKKITDDKKPVIIVLNLKLDVDDETLGKQKNKIYEHLSKAKIDKNNCPLIAINATSAFKGRVENKNLLFENSNFAALEREIDEIMQKSGIKNVIKVTNTMFEEQIKAFFKNIDNKLDNPQIKCIEEEITKCTHLKRVSEQELRRIANNTLSGLQQSLQSAYNSGSESSANATLEDYTKRIEQAIQAGLEKEAKELNTSFEKLKLEYEQIAINESGSKEKSYLNKTADSRNSKTLAAVGGAIAFVPHPLAKFAGTAIIAVAAIGELLRNLFANKADEENRRAEAGARAIADAIKQATNHLSSNVDEYISKGVNSLFEPHIANLNKALDEYKGDDSILRELKKNLEQILNRLPVLG